MRYRMWLEHGVGGKRENWCGITVDFPERVKESGFHYHVVHIPDDFPNATEIAAVFTAKNRALWKIGESAITIDDGWDRFAYLVPDEMLDSYDKAVAFRVEQLALARAMKFADKSQDFRDVLEWQSDFTQRFERFEKAHAE